MNDVRNLIAPLWQSQDVLTQMSHVINMTYAKNGSLYHVSHRGEFESLCGRGGGPWGYFVSNWDS
ncbi:hypothetical protein GQ600_9394 [Phytophthora cactorum]|nr:hypothetical protein GQ600_9394 [Phytophthora cactorum]